LYSIILYCVILLEVTREIFQIGSIQPGAYLFEAERKFNVSLTSIT